MALWRKHKDEWEKSQRPIFKKSSKSKSKAGHVSSDEEEEGLEIKPNSNKSKKRKIDELEEYPGAGVKGYSSGLSTIIKRRDSDGAKSGSKKADWWSTLPERTASKLSRKEGSKGGIRLHLGN